MMRFFAVVVVAASLIVGTSRPAVAQQPAPQAPQARRQTAQERSQDAVRAELLQQLRQRFITSGMTREQLHARLREAGYPEDMLDSYLPGSKEIPKPPTEDVYTALRDIGVADSTDIEFFRTIASNLPGTKRDSLLRSRGLLRDSLTFPVERRPVVRADVEDSLVRVDSGYNIFGLDVFRSETSTFDPNAAGPVDENYRLGPGDKLNLILTGDVEAVHSLDVNREGFIVIPQVGQLYVANLTLEQLNDLLYSRLGRVYSGIRRGGGASTRFSVSVSKLRAIQIFVLGEVTRPGSYTVSSASTSIAALYAAGGPTAQGSMRDVQIKRGKKLVTSFDLYDYMLHGDASRDSRLETGDIVFVPPRGRRIRIVGEVIRPGTYELKAGETLDDAVHAAGGFRSDASRRRMQIERILPASQRTEEGRDRITIDVRSEHTIDGEAPQVAVEGGDVIRVFPVANRVRNTVVVDGNVWSPGAVGLTPGMTVADAIRLAGGPKPDVYLGRILVDRLKADSSRIQLRAEFTDSLGAVTNDFPVNEDDIIQVFSVSEFRPERFVAVGGAVRKPGRYPYRTGMTMRDLVLLAGGLKEGAFLKEAEIARLPNERTSNATATTVRVPLDSTYLFERREGERYVGAPGLPAARTGAPEVPLMPYDNVLVLQQPSWELQRVVMLSGEVNFPGPYVLRTRSERLSDLIARAGGLTTEAYPEGTTFLRKRGNIGRVAIDVPRALKNPKSAENLLLADGDEVVIPTRSNVVTVRGSVNAPNVVAYVPGRGIDYYVAQAGGASNSGDAGHAFVTQPSGKRETKGRWRSPEPLPGSFVIVPEKGPASQWLATAGALAQVMTSFLAVYGLLRATR